MPERPSVTARMSLRCLCVYCWSCDSSDRKPMAELAGPRAIGLWLLCRREEWLRDRRSYSEVTMEAGPLNVTEHDPSNPREIFRLLWRRRKILLLCIVIIPIAAYLYSEHLTKSYESSTVLQIQQVG